MKKKIILASMLPLLFLAAVHSEGLSTTRTKEASLGDFDYLIFVPAAWKAVTLEEGVSMKLHMETGPAGKVIGHFTGHVLDRNGANLEKWFSYHREKNLPSVHGPCRVIAMEDGIAGRYEAKILQAIDLEKHRGYGLLDVLVCTESHAIILSYLYDLEKGVEARADMARILASFHHSPDAAERTRLDFEVVRTLGLEEFGLFLRLPEGWIPERTGRKRFETEIGFPGGSLTVFTFKRAASGLESLKKLLKKRCPLLPLDTEPETMSFGVSANRAFLFRGNASEDKAGAEGILGLHGSGGYALVLSPGGLEEAKTLRKIAAKAVLLDTGEAGKLRCRACKSFREALRENDTERVSEALSDLVLFSGNRSVSREIRRGFRSPRERIQSDCAAALGRMGSRDAAAALENALKVGNTSGTARMACISALGLIGGETAKKALIRVERRLHGTCPSEIRNTVKQTLMRLSD